MQRLVLVHLNWLGRHTWISGKGGHAVRSRDSTSALMGCCSPAGVRGPRGGVGNLPQLASSELSWQSLSPSQMKAGLVQIPVEHWNCPGLHLNSAVGRGGQGETPALGNIFRANLNLPLFPLWGPLQGLSNQHARRWALTAAKRAAAGCCLPSGYILGRESELLCSRLH